MDISYLTGNNRTMHNLFIHELNIMYSVYIIKRIAGIEVNLDKEFLKNVVYFCAWDFCCSRDHTNE